MAANNPLNAYKETQIKTASQGKLIIMLYDGAIRQVDAGIEALRRDAPALDSVNNALVKAQDLVTELMVSLDFDRGGEIAQTLFNLYMFFNRQLIEANIKKDSGPLVEVRQMLAELRSAWIEIVGRGEPSPDDDRGGSVNIAG
jgi:flagellar protein FliS